LNAAGIRFVLKTSRAAESDRVPSWGLIPSLASIWQNLYLSDPGKRQLELPMLWCGSRWAGSWQP